MRNHPIRKFFGLTILYSAVIIGIFVLQFKTESVISKKIGLMDYSVSQSVSENNEILCKNQFRLRFSSLVFSCDDKNPVLSFDSEGNSYPIVLSSFEEVDGSTVKFNFSDGTAVSFASINEEMGAFATFGEGVAAVTVPFKVAAGAVTEAVSGAKLIFTSKAGEYEFNAAEISSSFIKFTKAEPVARYSEFQRVIKFTFESLVGMPGSTKESFDATSERVRSSFVTKFTEAVNGGKADSLSEEDVAAYISEMAKEGRYNYAIDFIPDSFKKGNKRTYITSPFFGGLNSATRTLTNQTEKYNQYINSSSLDVFAVRGIGEFIVRRKNYQKTQQFLASFASQTGFNPDPFQAATIIDVYCTLKERSQELSVYLEPIIDLCVDSIQNASSLEEGKLVIKINEQGLEPQKMARVGNALVRLGNVKSSEILKSTGYLALNMAFEGDVPLKMVSSIYPEVFKNFYYPHEEILGYNGNEPIWAWTCARSASYSFSKETQTGTLNIDFPQNLSHYMILQGINDFNKKIEMQGVKYRTDPRFETYNSSGYVYLPQSKTLLLKSKHRSRTEIIRFYFTESEAWNSLPREIKESESSGA